MPDIFALEQSTTISKNDSYLLSYPHLLNYFAAKSSFSAEDLVCGAHMVYGWMPTILDLYAHKPNIDLTEAACIMNTAKSSGILTDNQIIQLGKLVNNSLVGASKLLHFISPEHFAIWDSKVYAYIFREKAHNYRVNDVSKYRHYMRHLDNYQQDDRFSSFHSSVNSKVGYDLFQRTFRRN